MDELKRGQLEIMQARLEVFENRYPHARLLQVTAFVNTIRQRIVLSCYCLLSQCDRFGVVQALRVRKLFSGYR